VKHDPEKSAAEFLGGAMSRRRRKSFEEHILGCEDCWHEVEVGRSGRAVAESGRELAPQPMRERVRAVVETLPTRPRRHRLRFTAGLGLLAIAVASGVVLFDGDERDQPVVIDAVLADFRAETPAGSVMAPSLPHKLGDMRLNDARRGRLGGVEVVVHAYSDRSGNKVVIYQSDETFPVARGADHVAPVWSADVDGVKLFCSDKPVPSLVVGRDRLDVDLAADELGLK
jgi:hypothetical protein